MKTKPKFAAIAFLAILLLLAGTNCYGAEPKTKAALAGEGFIFTYTPIITGDDSIVRGKRISAIGGMMGTEMTHVAITFWPIVPMNASIQDYMDYATNNGHELALEISAGMCPYDGYSDALEDNVCFNSPELFEIEGNDGNQYLKAPCLIRQDKCIALGCTFSGGKCQNCPITSEIADHWADYVDKERCEKWNARAAIDPSYNGPLWQNTLKNTAAIVARAKALNYQPDIVLFDTEIWENPKGVESLFNANDPFKNCGCNVIQDGIKEPAYYDAWKKRGQELAQAVKNVDDTIKVNFYNELPAGTRWIQEYNGQDVNVIGYMPSGIGDFAGPSLYVLPNLELLEKDIASMAISGTLPRISPTYMYGYNNFFKYASNYGPRADALSFDTSVSREAGRMLKKAGTKGFVVYPNAYVAQDWYGDEGYAYWLAHATAMIAGFKEGADYVEKNKIRNPGFEAFKTKAPGFDWSAPAYVELRGSALVEPIQFAPVFWKWTDSSSSYKNSAWDANLSLDKQSGLYSWRHTRTGDIGVRTIESNNFSITGSEAGNYSFSIRTKASINSSKGTIKFSLVNTNTSAEQPLGETGFATGWAEFKKDIYTAAGNYKIKILLQDNTGQKVDIFLDNASFEKTTAPECVETETLLKEHIRQWEIGTMTMRTLIQKIRLWNTKEGCPPE